VAPPGLRRTTVRARLWTRALWRRAATAH
jgi:hypothetical protein